MPVSSIRNKGRGWGGKALKKVRSIYSASKKFLLLKSLKSHLGLVVTS